MPVETLISLRKGSASLWSSTNPVLSSGEPGYDITNKILKIGDGATPWNTLSNHNHLSENITDFNSSVSGLLPVKNIIAGTYITVNNVSGIFTVGSTGEANLLKTVVFNKTGSQIPKLTPVYINGGQGDQPTVTLASSSGELTSSKTYGITAENIDNMSTGTVVVAGALTGVNTDQFNPTAPAGDVNGTTLWLGSTPGSITTTKPVAPNHMVALGTIIRTHQNEGIVEVKIQNGFELEELHNVAISGVTNGQFLQYNTASGLWLASSSGNFSSLSVNSTGVSLVGHTHTASNITDFNSSVSGLLSTISNSGDNRILTSTGSTVGINAENNLTFDGSLINVTGSGSFSSSITASGFVRSGGTSSQFLKADGSVDTNSYYLNSNPSGYTNNTGTVTSVAALTLGTTGTDVSSSVANSTTTPVITLNIPTASSANRGALSSTDWTTFNNKQNALTNPVTGTGTLGYLSRFNASTGLTNSIVFESGTRLGINTVTPSGALHIVGTGLIASVTGTAPTSLLHLYSATSGASIFNVEGTNGSLFSVDDNLSGTLMSVNNNAGLPVFEVFSDDSVVAGRFNRNDFVINSSGNIGIGGAANNSYKLQAIGNVNVSGVLSVNGVAAKSKTLCTFTASNNQPPASAFATVDTRNSIVVLDFDDTTKETAIFLGIMPDAAALGSGLSIRLHWMATTATTGDVRWEVSIERSNTDLDADSFDTVNTGSSTTNGTSGIITTTSITLTTIDGVTAGDVFRLRISRDAANAADTMVGDAELVAVEIRSIA